MAPWALEAVLVRLVETLAVADFLYEVEGWDSELTPEGPQVVYGRKVKMPARGRTPEDALARCKALSVEFPQVVF